MRLLDVNLSTESVREVACFLRRGSKVLLGKRLTKRAHGVVSGFGGHVKPGEDAETAVKREVWEECGIRCDAVTFAANLIILSVDEDLRLVDGYRAKIFQSTEFTGAPTETREMKPLWYEARQLPFSEMWNSDIHWLPHAINGRICNVRIVRSSISGLALSSTTCIES